MRKGINIDELVDKKVTDISKQISKKTRPIKKVTFLQRVSEKIKVKRKGDNDISRKPNSKDLTQELQKSYDDISGNQVFFIIILIASAITMGIYYFQNNKAAGIIFIISILIFFCSAVKIGIYRHRKRELLPQLKSARRIESENYYQTYKKYDSRNKENVDLEK
jgi:Flp pilus assembly protein TadB